MLAESTSLVKILYQQYLAPYLLWILLGSFVVDFLVTKFNRHYYDIPGPFFASFTGLWRAWDTLKGNAMSTDIELHKRYGPIIRVGPKHISFSDPEAIKVIYSVGGGFHKTAFYPPMSALYEGKVLFNLFSSRDEEYHSKLKRPVAHTYSMAALKDLEPKIDHVSNLFIDRLNKDYAQKGVSIDLGKWLQFYAFDVIGNITFSQTLGFIEQACDVDDMIARIGGFMAYASVIGCLPWLHYLLAGNPILPIVFPAIETFNPAVNFALKCIKQSEETNAAETTDQDDFLIRLQKMQREGKKGFGRAELVNHTSSNVLAGSDTTAIALRSIVHNLITNPLCYKKLQDEIDSFDAAGKLSDPIQESESARMPYTQAIIKEAMRMHPSVGMMMERHVPKGGAVICGRFFPEGTVVGMNPWVVARHKPTYGDDVDVFRPERWLDADEEQLKAMERASLAFGAGSRVCIGKNISIMEMSKCVPQLFREFDITLVNPDKNLKVDDYWFPVQHGLLCRLTRRRKELKSQA